MPLGAPNFWLESLGHALVETCFSKDTSVEGELEGAGSQEMVSVTGVSWGTAGAAV